MRAAAALKCSVAYFAYRSTITRDFQPPKSFNSSQLVPA
jgi:hypothetical protein